LELKCQGIPIVLLGALVALAIPVLYALGITPGGGGYYMLDFLFPLIVFFGGIGIAISNRRLLTAGYMSAFEGTRGMSTIALTLLQLLAVGRWRQRVVRNNPGMCERVFFFGASC
jgi:hypothetical protein